MPLSRSVIALLVGLVALLVAGPAAAQLADHLLISEVAYDTTANPELAEFVEIFNPTDSEVPLNDGTAAWFLSDDEDAYWEVAGGTVATSASDWCYRFPEGSVLPARSFAVIARDADAFLTEFFGGPANYADFIGQPGSPQLFEAAQDADSYPDMEPAGTGSTMSLANSGEGVVLFWWDGASDLIQDGDYLAWGSATLIDKTAVSFEGIDPDPTASTYGLDVATATTAWASAPNTLQRTAGFEPSELTAGGNGLGGDDETSEDLATSFSAGAATPGRWRVTLDGDLSDLATASAPLAVSMADGPGAGATADFGANGTITELYALPYDEDGDGTADLLLIGVRGEFFTDFDSINGTYVVLDVDPGSGAGVTVMSGDGNALDDSVGSVDNDLTEAGILLSASLVADSIAFDAAVGATYAGCPDPDLCGVRGWGTDGVAGLLTDFAWLGGLSDLAIGSIDPALPAAIGAGYAAPDGLEFAVELIDLADPTVVALAAFTSADDSFDPSPNTLPENSSDAFTDEQTIEEVVCLSMDGSGPPTWYLDPDGDGYGDATTGVVFCGAVPGGMVPDAGDCGEGDATVNPAATEVCDGATDEDCDGLVDEGFDGDGDGYTSCSGDCDDSDGTISPAEPEICDGIDQDCDADIDEDFDVDGDGDTTCAGDCDDGDPTVGPSAAEICDLFDQDCDSDVDEDFDGDGDGWMGDASCLATYLVLDCDDADAAVNPDATEVCDGATDEDCSGAVDDIDVDVDGYQDGDCGGDDCDDGNASIHPGQPELCFDSLDNDCDGDVDTADDDCATDDDDVADDDDAVDDDDSADDDDVADDDDSATDDDDAVDDDDSVATDDDDVVDDDDITIEEPPVTRGCSCATSPGADGAPLMTGLLLLPLLGLRRRRDRTRGDRMSRLLVPLALLALLLPTTASAQDESTETMCATARGAVQTWIDHLQPDDDRPGVATLCFDWRSGPAASADRAEVARKLLAVLDGQGKYVVYDEIPVDPEWKDSHSDLHRYTLFPTLPEVFVEQIDGSWLISSTTVASTDRLYKRTYRIPIQRFANKLPQVFRSPVLGVAIWQWLALVVLVLLAIVLGKVLEIVLVGGLRRLIRRFFASWDETFEKAVMKRVNLLFAAGLVGILLPNIGLPVRFNMVLFVLVKLTVSVAAVLIVTGIIDLVFDAWGRVAASTDTKMDDQLVPLMRRAAKVLVFVIGGLFVLQNLDVDVGSLIAGLGLGGLAFALAAKDTLANLFGSFTIFADRPFQIGDDVSIAGVDGAIEEVGFRSTRIRTYYGSLVTLPNSKVADALIDNLGKRATRRIKLNLSLTYDTTPDQMQAFVEGVRASILASPWTKKTSFEVHFAEMGASSLDVMVVCYSDSRGYRDYLEAKHHLMLEWMRLAEDLGVEFAFPTQTLHLESVAATSPPGDKPVMSSEDLGQTVAGYAPEGERGTPRTPDVSAGFWPEVVEE